MRLLRSLLVAALSVALAGCGERAQDPPVRPVEVQGIDPDDTPEDLGERGRRPSETFCDGPNSTASSC